MIGGRNFDSEFSVFLKELKERSDIVEVIRSYVAVDRKGGNYWACCPFHHEKTPSFAVNEAEQAVNETEQAEQAPAVAEAADEGSGNDA